MAAKSTPKARSRSKAQSSEVVANILFIDPSQREKANERRKEKEFLEYRDSLSEDGRKIFFKALKFLVTGRAAKDEGKICKIITFHASGKLSKEV